MNRKDKPAFPRSSQGPMGDLDRAEGATLREVYAGWAMKGLLANPVWAEAMVAHRADYKTIARDAVRCADALINELEKETQ